MSRLLNAEFSRLWKNRFFYMLLLFMFAFGLVVQIFQYLDHTYTGLDWQTETGFFAYSCVIGILQAAFISLFTGTEYSDGTIRNKLILGHSRGAIYLAGLIVNTAAGLLMCIAFMFGSLLTGLPLSGFFTNDIRIILVMVLCTFFMTLSFTSLAHLTAMLCQSRAAAAVINLLCVFLLLFASVMIQARLQEPELYEYYYLNDTGEVSLSDPEPNPGYLRGTKRQVYEFLDDFLPTGQSLALTQLEVENPLRLDLYSAAITIVSTGVGIFVFRRKDIK